MTHKDLLIGIVFDKVVSFPPYDDELLSEETVEDTAREVFDILSSAGHAPVLVPLKDSLVRFLRRLQELKVDVVINLCEGFRGCPQLEANVAAALELMGTAFTGNTSQTLGLCQDKFKAKAVLSSHGLPTPRSCLLTSEDDPFDLSFPVIVKPNCEDASVGISPCSVVHNEEALVDRVKKILETFRQPALVEEFIEGREFNIAIMQRKNPRPLPVSEIDYSRMPDALPNIISY